MNRDHDDQIAQGLDGKKDNSPRKLFARPGVIACCVVVAASAGAFSWFHLSAHAEPQSKGAASRPPVAVSVLAAKKQDVPMIIDGLGTVQPTFTVGIHSQIDGKLQDVLFAEGQRVKKGDLLARIEARPQYKAAMAIANPKKA